MDIRDDQSEISGTSLGNNSSTEDFGFVKQMTNFDLLNSPIALKESTEILQDVNKSFFVAKSLKISTKKCFSPKGIGNVSKQKSKIQKMKEFVDSIKRKPSSSTVTGECSVDAQMTDNETQTEIDVKDKPMLKELMERVEQKGDFKDSAPSDGSYLPMLFQNYEEKLSQYSQNSQRIKNTTFEQLGTHFEGIRDDIIEIFTGNLESSRKKLLVEGNMSKLKEVNVSIPFTGRQANFLISKLFNEIAKSGDRINYVNMVSMVLLPESYIRIYSRVNGLSYENSEIEMRYGALH